MTNQRARWSWRDDPDVPNFDDAAPLAVMDGDCALCIRGARLLHRYDRSGDIRIATAASSLGQALFNHFGLRRDDPESWLFLENGHAYEGFEGMARAGARCGGPLRFVRLSMFLPAPVRQWLYARIARNRIAVFGRGDICAVPDPAFQARLIE